MTLVGAALTVLIALALLVVGLTVLEVMRRHGWRPVDRLADLVSYGPSSGPQEAPALGADVDLGMVDDD